MFYSEPSFRILHKMISWMRRQWTQKLISNLIKDKFLDFWTSLECCSHCWSMYIVYFLMVNPFSPTAQKIINNPYQMPVLSPGSISSELAFSLVFCCSLRFITGLKLSNIHSLHTEDILLLYCLPEFEICTARQSPAINRCSSAKINEFAFIWTEQICANYLEKIMFSHLDHTML